MKCPANHNLTPWLVSLLRLTILSLFLISCNPVKFSSQPEVSTKTCVGEECDVPPTYSWFTSDYSMCSKACGGGEQVRTVECRRQDGVTVADNLCSGTKPASVRSCNVQACAGTYTWNIGEYGNCSQTCGGGTQTREVICQNQSGQTVNDNNCPTPKPATSRSCNLDPCPPESYEWEIGNYSSCSKSCGGGIRTRTVVCRKNDGTVADSNLCPQPKPQESETCNTHPCTVDYTYSWQTGSYGTCSKTCGGGIQTRSVFCVRSDDEFVAENFCSASTKPVTQRSCNTQACSGGNIPKTTTKTVQATDNQVDILLIVDDSSSMEEDQKKLAARMSGFIEDLESSNLDYQVCITATNVDFYTGRPILWVGSNNKHIMIPSMPNKQNRFRRTIDAIGSGYSNDEQGIKAANLFVQQYAQYGCIRPKAAFSVILLSDEDERSVGGLKHLSHAQYKPLGPLNTPQSFISTFHNTFSTPNFIKPLTWNSIIVIPGDTACEAEQDAQGTPSFPGRLYQQLSQMTNGHVGSICANDYSQNLKYFKERIKDSLAALELECVPVGTPQVTLQPNFSTNITVQGNEVRFDPALPVGTKVTVNYFCPQE